MSPSEAKVQLPLRVSPDHIRRLDLLADRMGLDRSEVARRALRNGIEELEGLTKLAANPVADLLFRFVNLMETDQEHRDELLRLLDSLRDHKNKSKQEHKAKTTDLV